jgi:hypothetical protein
LRTFTNPFSNRRLILKIFSVSDASQKKIVTVNPFAITMGILPHVPDEALVAFDAIKLDVLVKLVL